MKKFIKFVVLFLVSILFMQFVWFFSASQPKNSSLFAEKVNLALRRTAHLLLKDVGDSTSLIPPVLQINDKTWVIQLERAFTYEKLPDLLQSSFTIQQIQQNYNVAILSCNDGQLLLGYNYQDFFQNKDLSCGNRVRTSDCRNIQVTFLDAITTTQQFPLTGWVFAVILALGLFYLSQKIVAKTTIKDVGETNESTFISFGQSRFDLANQVLVCGSVTHALTYREAKLLNLFVQNQNLVLERSFILENVWADEGILVGRSLDMFVSRLRKMLRDDATIQLIAVHGVGYRLEVSGLS
jgi:hypothetical protein